MGFFVSRHLGLLGCNIADMKRFLPLLILTGLLFGQESTIVLKDGKTIKGTIVSEEEYEYTVQVVKVYGYSRYEKIKILKSDIVTIESEINTTQEEDKGTNIDSDRQKLFVQDVLLHKSGEVYKGIYIGKVDEDIIFKLEGEKSNSAFSINDVDIVITSRGGIKVELYYPFDTSTKKDNPSFGQDGLILKSGKVYNGTFIGKVDKLIVFQVEGKNDLTKFPVNDVAIIKTSEGELTYPFKNPTKVEEDKSGFWKRAAEAYLTGNMDEYLKQNPRKTPPCGYAISCGILLWLLSYLRYNPVSM